MIEIILLLFIYLFILPTHVQAYLDPGTGSYITQVIIGFLVGGVYLGKAYWRQLKSRISDLINRMKKDGKEKKED